MNEEVNFCSQCGAKVNSGAKFCLSCGYDLKNSSTKITLDNKITLDKPIKVEVTNVTAEKGFKAIQKGVKSTGKVLKMLFKTKEKTSKPDLETPSPKHREWPPVHRDGPLILHPFVSFVLIPLAVVLGFFLLMAEMTNN